MTIHGGGFILVTASSNVLIDHTNGVASHAAIPAIYGIATGLPVLVFAVLIATGVRRVGAAFDRLTAIELWARRITGAAFILAGILYSLTYIFGIPVLG